jgi:Family of unknown function (DUF6353)
MNNQWLKRLGQGAQQNSPWILSGIAVAGVIGTAFLAAKGTPKALEKLSELKEDKALEQNCDHGYAKVTRKEIVLATWKPYIPAALAGTATITCIIASTQIGMRRQAALVGAYALLDNAYHRYKDEVLEQIGEKKEQQISDGVAQKRVNELPSSNQVVFLGKGDVLCLDDLSGRYFKSDHEAIRRAINDVDAEVLQQGYSDLNKFYELVGLPVIDLGELLGWNLDHRPEFAPSTALNDCGQPCLVVAFRFPPIHDYSKIF